MQCPILNVTDKGKDRAVQHIVLRECSYAGGPNQRERDNKATTRDVRRVT